MKAPNSLPGVGQSRETWTVSAFLGVRLWQGGELYYNPELLQGFGVADTVGAGGYPNGEAQKSNFPYPRYNTSRLFLRQEIGLGGERKKVESEYGQLAGEKDISRLTFQVGKFAVHDLFDTNPYASDSRIDFLNWSIWAAGAFDYPADRVGLTYGITAELNQPRWAARVGYFLVGNEPNANVFDMNLFARGGYVGELEMRFKPYDRPGTAKLGVWLTSTFAGSYNEARRPRRRTGIDAGRHHRADPPGPHQVRLLSQPAAGDQRRSRPVRALELERRPHRNRRLHRHRRQPVGRPAPQGTSWGRPNDEIGLGGAWNMISRRTKPLYSRPAGWACWSATAG